MSVNEQSLKNKINAGNPNVLADQARAIALGSVIRAVPTFLRKKAPAASAGVLAALAALTLPDDAKGATIIAAYARAGGVTGPLTIVAFGATPGTGEIAIAPNGDIVTLAADAITDLDVAYQPDKYDIVSVTLPVAADVLTIPATFADRGVVMLLDATADAGTATGRKIALVPGAGAPAAGQARLNVAKDTVTFAAADAVTTATVMLAVSAAIDVDALLTAETALA